MYNLKEVHVVGYANEQNLYGQNWAKSLRNSRFSYTAIGKGDKWIGLVTRIRSYLEFLRSQALDDQVVYVLTDVYDLLAIGTEAEFLQKWSQFGTPIVIGAEPNCNRNLCRPLENYWDVRPDEYRRTKNRYLNFGLVAGLQSSLIKFFQWLCQDAEHYHPELWNEQIAASKYIDLYPNEISLDTEMELVGNILCHPTCGNISQFKWIDFLSDGYDPFIGQGRVVYRRTEDDYLRESYPVFIHTPSKGIDACQRYQKYGQLILKDEFRSPCLDMIKIPGYHWVWLAIIIVIIILWFIFGLEYWIIVGFIVAFVIIILYLLSL